MGHSIPLERETQQRWCRGQVATLRRLDELTMRNIAWTRKAVVSESLIG